MIGNAVPVNLAKFVAEGIKTYLKTGSQRQLSLLDLIDLTQKIKHDFTLPKKSLKNV